MTNYHDVPAYDAGCLKTETTPDRDFDAAMDALAEGPITEAEYCGPSNLSWEQEIVFAFEKRIRKALGYEADVIIKVRLAEANQ